MAVWHREDPIRNFLIIKDIFYLDSPKVDVVKMIFHVLLIFVV